MAARQVEFDRSIEEIAMGGQARVYKVLQNGKWYAMKKFNSLEDLMTEFSVLLDLEKRCPGVFPYVYNLFQHQGLHAFTLDLFHTSPQEMYLANELKEKEVFAYGVDIAEQL